MTIESGTPVQKLSDTSLKFPKTCNLIRNKIDNFVPSFVFKVVGTSSVNKIINYSNGWPRALENAHGYKSTIEGRRLCGYVKRHFVSSNLRAAMFN